MATQNTFDFGDQQAATQSLKKISQLMQRAGQPVVSSSFDQKLKRTSGVSYCEAMLTLASGQTITLRVTQTGDVFQVLLNGQVKPIKNAGDQIRAVGEIAKLAEANQAAFQKKQARVKTELPKGIKTAAPKMEVALQSRASELDAQIAERTQQVAELKAELGDDSSGGVPVITQRPGYINKFYSVSRWSNYSPVGSIGNVSGMTKESTSTVMSGRNTLVTTWLDENGSGYELRETQLADGDTLDSVMDRVDHNWHSRTMDGMKLKTDDSLRYIYKDATEAAEAGEKMDNPKSGQYRDEAHYAAMELERRRKLRTGGQLAKAMAKAVKSANNGKLLIANVPDDLKFAVTELIKSGVLATADFAGNKAIRMTDAALDSATLDAARKHNQKDYVVYVVVGNKIESGWSFDEDAKEHKAENMPENLKASAKVVKKAALKSKGIDPDDNASWLTGAQLDSTDLAEALDVSAQALDGAVLDSASTASAVATLRIALQVVENNYPINLAAGNIEQAQLEQENAESFRNAIALLDGVEEPDMADEAKPSDAADEALRAAEELQDGLDSAEEDDDSAEVSPDQESLFA